MELDPTNTGWLEQEMEVAGFEVGLLLDDQPVAARKLLDDLIAGEPVRR